MAHSAFGFGVFHLGEFPDFGKEKSLRVGFLWVLLLALKMIPEETKLKQIGNSYLSHAQQSCRMRGTRMPERIVIFRSC
eukprot:2654887-Amphidinium_carterae.2